MQTLAPDTTTSPQPKIGNSVVCDAGKPIPPITIPLVTDERRPKPTVDVTTVRDLETGEMFVESVVPVPAPEGITYEGELAIQREQQEEERREAFETQTLAPETTTLDPTKQTCDPHPDCVLIPPQTWDPHPDCVPMTTTLPKKDDEPDPGGPPEPLAPRPDWIKPYRPWPLPTPTPEETARRREREQREREEREEQRRMRERTASGRLGIALEEFTREIGWAATEAIGVALVYGVCWSIFGILWVWTQGQKLRSRYG